MADSLDTLLITFGFGTPALQCAMGTGFALRDGHYRRDAAKLPYLLVVPVAVALASALHRGWYAALNLAGSPLLRSAYHFVNVLYLSVLVHLVIVTHAVAERVSFRAATFDFTDHPFLLSAAVFKHGIRNFAKHPQLAMVRRAVKFIGAKRPTHQSSFAALGIAAFDVATAFRVMVMHVLFRMKGFEIFGIVVRVISVLVMNVVKLAKLAVAYRNRAVSLNIGNLVSKQNLVPYFSVFKALAWTRLYLFNNFRISVNTPTVIVHRTPTATEGRFLATTDRTFAPNVSFHNGQLNGYLNISQ